MKDKHHFSKWWSLFIMMVNMDTSLGFLSLPSQCLNFRLFSLGFPRLLTLKNSLVKARTRDPKKFKPSSRGIPTEKGFGFARLLTLKNSLVKTREPETKKSLNLPPEGYPLRKFPTATSRPPGFAASSTWRPPWEAHGRWNSRMDPCWNSIRLGGLWWWTFLPLVANLLRPSEINCMIKTDELFWFVVMNAQGKQVVSWGIAIYLTTANLYWWLDIHHMGWLMVIGVCLGLSLSITQSSSLPQELGIW